MKLLILHLLWHFIFFMQIRIRFTSTITTFMMKARKNIVTEKKENKTDINIQKHKSDSDTIKMERKDVNLNEKASKNTTKSNMKNVENKLKIEDKKIRVKVNDYFLNGRNKAYKGKVFLQIIISISTHQLAHLALYFLQRLLELVTI